MRRSESEKQKLLNRYNSLVEQGKRKKEAREIIGVTATTLHGWKKQLSGKITTTIHEPRVSKGGRNYKPKSSSRLMVLIGNPSEVMEAVRGL